MRRRKWIPALLAASAALLLTAAPAGAQPLETVQFPGGEIVGLEYDDSFSQGSLENVLFESRCSVEPNCTWTITVGLSSSGEAGCDASSEEFEVGALWSSAEQTGQGRVESGPLEFVLDGEEGRSLCVYVQHTTSQLQITSAVAAVRMPPEAAWILLENRYIIPSPLPVEETITTANPPAATTPRPSFPRPTFNANCHRLTLAGNTVLAFFFKRLGCRRAQSLALNALASNRAPAGYRSARFRGPLRESRYARIGHARKYFGWRDLPPA